MTKVGWLVAFALVAPVALGAACNTPKKPPMMPDSELELDAGPDPVDLEAPDGAAASGATPSPAGGLGSAGSVGSSGASAR